MKKKAYMPKHCVIKCKGHSPKHLSSAKKDVSICGVFAFSASVIFAALLCLSGKYVPFLLIFGAGAFVAAILAVTQKKTFLSTVAVVLSSAAMLAWTILSAVLVADFLLILLDF